jgi:hypothetical protein
MAGMGARLLEITDLLWTVDADSVPMLVYCPYAGVPGGREGSCGSVMVHDAH